MTKVPLFKDFPPISSEAWRSKVEEDLKGADFNKKLVWKTEEGFEVMPFYRRDDLEGKGVLNGGLAITARESEGNSWMIRQDFSFTLSPEECNCIIKGALNKGVQAIGLNLAGYDPVDKKNLRQLLDGIDLSFIALYFKGCKDPEIVLETLQTLAGEQQVDLAAVKGSLGMDPLGKLASTGEYDEDSISSLSGLIEKYSDLFPNFKLITIDAGLFQDGGSTLSQELGFGLAMAAEYLKLLTDEGHSVTKVIKTLAFSFATGPNYFMEIAKLRAARWLWNALGKAWEADGISPMHIHSRSAAWNLTLYEPNVNMLRTTTEAMSASLGGSDVISLHPFDTLYKEENNFSSRIAKNIQVILKEEAYFDKVSDPAAGSYYIEKLTDSIGKQAWKHFLEVDEKGGFREALTTGIIAGEVTEAAQRKIERAASRRDTILGVNQYPNFNEMIWKEGLKVPADISKGSVSGKSQSSQSTSKKSDETWEFASFPAIQPFRAAGEIEKLRLATEQSGKRPKVFLLKYGDPVWRTARAMFSGNFFACAGYEIIDKGGFNELTEGIEAAKKVKPHIMVLCSSDDSYLEAAKAAMKSGTSAEIVIAGYPKETLEELQQVGIQHFIHVRSNLLEELEKFHKIFQIGS